MNENAETALHHLLVAKNLIEKTNLNELDFSKAAELLKLADYISAYINENYDFVIDPYFQLKQKVRAEICLNSNQPKDSEVEEYDLYVYDSNEKEIKSLRKPNQLAFEVLRRLGKIRSDYEITDVAWLDLKGNRMNPID